MFISYIQPDRLVAHITFPMHGCNFTEHNATIEEELDDEMQDVEAEEGQNEATPHQAYLETVLARVMKSEQQPSTGIPSPCTDRNGWVLPPSIGEIFSKLGDLHPDRFIRPRVFLNRPHLFTKLACPSCRVELHGHGWSKRFRRIIDLEENWFLISPRYKCPTCLKTYVGHMPAILSQLPTSLQKLFPAHLTHRSGISSTLFNMLRPMFNSRMGPKATANLLQEMHRMRYDCIQLAYLEAVKRQVENPSATTFGKTLQYEPFPAYKGSYGGFTPSANYLKTIYIALQQHLEPRCRQYTSMLPANVLASDHSFKLPKRIAKVDGCPVFTAVHSLSNEFGEVRFHQLTTTKSLQEVKPQIKQMLVSLKKYGHDQPQLLFVDDPRGERSFFEENIPSLRANVQHVTSYSSLPALIIPVDTMTVVEVRNAADCNHLVDLHILDKLSPNSSTLMAVGFDCEWPFDSNTNSVGRIATIQIATDAIVLVVALAAMQHLPVSIRTIIADPRIMKVGRNVGGDLAKLSRDMMYAGPICGKVELGALAKRLSFVKDGRASLAKLTAIVLGKQLLKPQHIRLSTEWDAQMLSSEQLMYAALDAHASLQIYLKMTTQAQQLPCTIEDGLSVEIMARDNTNMTIAYGTIVLPDNNEPCEIFGMKITKSRVRVCVTQIFVPAALLPLCSGMQILSVLINCQWPSIKIVISYLLDTSFGSLCLPHTIVVPTKQLRLPSSKPCAIEAEAIDFHTDSINLGMHFFDFQTAQNCQINKFLS